MIKHGNLFFSTRKNATNNTTNNTSNDSSNTIYNNINNNISGLFLYDIFENVIEYLDPISIVNLTESCKKLSDLYYVNEKIINKNIVSKIFKHFNLNNPKNYMNCMSLYDLKHFKAHSYNIYKYFCNHRNSNISDFLIYYIENVTSFEPNLLLKYLISLCDKKIYFCNRNTDCQLKYKLTTNDIIYLLTFSNYSDFCIFLHHFEIKPNLISYIIKEMIVQKNNKSNKNFTEKITKSLDYYFYKFLFGRYISNKTFSLFLNHIVSTVIQYNEIQFFDFIIFKKRRYETENRNRFELNYQMLIINAIESNNIVALNKIWDEYLFDAQNDNVLIITPELITMVCKNGWFDILEWVVNNLLLHSINLKSYISSIKQGLFIYAYTISDNPVKNFSQLSFLSNFLSFENKQLLNNDLKLVSQTNKTLNQIYIIEF